MTKKKNISIVDFPEEEKVEGGFDLKTYGEMSHKNQLAALSHWLHNYRTEAAIVTHYLHNFGTVFANPCKNENLFFQLELKAFLL